MSHAGRIRFIYGATLFVLFTAGNAHAQVRVAPAKHPYQRLDSALAQIVVAADVGQPRSAALARLDNPLVVAEQVPVTITSDDVAAVSAWVRAVGGSVANSSQDTIEAYVSTDHLRDLDSLQGVVAVRQIIPAAERAISQGVAAHNASNWHANGSIGSGVKVGIIDVGFSGFSTLMGSEVPSAVTRRCYSAIGVFSADLAACQTTTNHGTAVTESLLDIAPGIQLFVANPKSHLDYRQTVDWMTSQGVRVINYSAATLWDGPGNGTSPYSGSLLRAVDAAIAGGAVFIAAAGNERTATYLGAFNDVNGNSWAEFGGFEDNVVSLEAGERVQIQLRWQDNWGFSARDLDLVLVNSSNQIVAYSANVQAGAAGAVPFEFLTYTAPAAGNYFIGVQRYAGSVPAWIQLQNFSGQTLSLNTPGSISSPAETANGGALAVGAAPWYSAADLEWFSSRGPTPDGRVKPDVVGVDRADTVTYGPAAFAGTSQASPHIAGLAALVLQQFPAYSPVEVANYLKTIAAPGSGPRPNNNWGYGLSILPNFAGPRPRTPDVDGDGRSDLAVFRPSTAEWYVRKSLSGYADVQVLQWGSPGDKPLTADFDGDSRIDLAVYRPSTGQWYVRYSSRDYNYDFDIFQWGLADDVPLTADFDGDGRSDLVVYRPSSGEWFIRQSSSGYNYAFLTFQWGLPTDKPIPSDFDGDGRSDLAVYRPITGEWFIRYSSRGYNYNFDVFQWGMTGDIPLLADFDGDGRTDLVVYRPATGMWYIRGSSSGYSVALYQWGLPGDIPLSGDFDGDQRADLNVYRPSTGEWLIRYSLHGYSSYAVYQWGLPGDTPLAPSNP